MGARERAKGHNWERELVRWFKRLGLKAKRNLEETREGSSGDVLVEWKSVCLVVEAKNVKKPRPWAALRQASQAATFRSDRDEEQIPMAIIKHTGHGVQVWIDPDALLVLNAQSNRPLIGAIRSHKDQRAIVFELDDLRDLLL